MTGPRPNFIDGIFGPQSDDVRGILNPEQQQAARRRSLFDAGIGMMAGAQGGTFGQSLAAGVQAGRGSYTGAVQDQLAGQDYQAKQRQMAVRGQITQQFAAQPNETPQQTNQRLRGMFAAFAQNGLTEEAKSLSEYLKSQGAPDAQPKPILDTINVGGETVDRRYDPAAGKYVEIGRTRNSPHPRDPNAGPTDKLTPIQAQRTITGINAGFARDTKDYAKASEAWTQVDHVLQRDRTGQHGPDDIVQLLDGISRLNNPGAVVRSSTVQLQLEKIGSWGDKLRMWASRGGTGKWPSDIVEGIGRAARAIAAEHSKQYKNIRDRAVRRGVGAGIPEIEGYLPNVWGVTGDPGEGQADPSELPHDLSKYKF